MDKQELLALLTKIAEARGGDPEVSHSDAERALLRFINDPEISEAWEKTAQFFWYA